MPAPAVPQSTYGAIPERSGLLRVLNNDQLNKMESDQKAAESMQNKPEIIGLANHIKKHWESAKNTKWFVEERLLKCIRQRKGKYDPDDLAHIRKFGGSQIFMMLTNVKCRTIEAWIKDVMLPAGEKPWGVSPSPVPDLPVEQEIRLTKRVQSEVAMILQSVPDAEITPDMIDQRMMDLRNELQREDRALASQEAERITDIIEDGFNQGDFYGEIAKFIKDFATYPTAFLKGPFIRRKKDLKWVDGPGGKRIPQVDWVYYRAWKCISPFDMYFAAGAKNINDGYCLERQRLRETDLVKMKGVPGFDTKAIDNVLMEYRGGMLQDWLWTDQERANIEFRPNEQEDPQAVIETLEYHGEIPGQLLIDWGMDKNEIENPAEPVPCVCLMVGRHVIMARLNENPLGTKPYYGASFDQSNDSIWGVAPPEHMEDCQRVCNATARAMINNLAIASGPQVEMHKDRIDPGDNLEELYPWKIWKTKSDPMGKNNKAIHFYQPNALTDMLMQVYQYFFNQAGEQLGVPAYESGVGSAASGAGQTAHGLSMLMSAASKIMKDAIVAIDQNVIKPIVKSMWTHILLFDDIDARGDIEVVARASEYLIQAEQLQARRAEFLALTNNDVDMAIIGYGGRAKILRENVKALKMQEEIIPEDADLEMNIQQNMMQSQMGLPMGGGGGSMPGRDPGENPLIPPLEQMARI